MTGFIQELRNEHAEIIERLRAIKRLGVHTMEGRNYLSELKSFLCQHIEKEDRRLYPALKDRIANDMELKKHIEAFEEEILEMSGLCKRFFDTYATEGGGIEFLSAFDKLHHSLENRIQREENILFQKYEDR